MNRIKPRLKRFEMHGNLSTIGYCGKCIKCYTNKPTDEIVGPNPCETEPTKAPRGAQ